MIPGGSDGWIGGKATPIGGSIAGTVAQETPFAESDAGEDAGKTAAGGQSARKYGARSWSQARVFCSNSAGQRAARSGGRYSGDARPA